MSKPVSHKSREARRSSSQPAKMHKDGLCSTCASANECVLAAKSAASIQFCEEFDVSSPSSEVSAVSGEIQPWETTPVEYPIEKRFAGLCANCGELAECAFSKPDCLVLHCEHYS